MHSRNEDPGYFCRAALKQTNADKFPLWIVSDCRRKTDFHFFETNFPGACIKVRVTASLATREKRGFVFQPNVDDAESECGLDNVTDLDFVLENEGDRPAAEIHKELVEKVNTCLA